MGNGNEILNPQEMKRIVGGQVVLKLCDIVSGSGIYTPDGNGGFTDDVVCGGECPTETVTGNTPSQKCTKEYTHVGLGRPPMISCVCK